MTAAPLARTTPTPRVVHGDSGTVPASSAREIADDLRRRILDGEFVTGTRLPSEHALAEDYGVSRASIRTALASVARRGLIESHRNAGWFVRLVDQVQGLDRVRSFTQWALDRGMRPGGEIVERTRGDATVREARLLRIPLAEEVVRFTRIRTLDGRIVMVERSTWAPWVTPVIEAVPRDVVSTTTALADAGIRVVLGTHRISAVSASSEDARLLRVRRSSALLAIHRSMFAPDGRAVEFGEDRYLPGEFAFEVTAADR
ncbi:GntR family transcriptional regulator [Microbacterium paludicola]|uniref:GntR family transcriptional regulator n=1 Tax=Microbacterium paludicola TaxID=300019 RepID=UPI0031D5913B